VDGVKVAIEALTDAADQDRATGGVDIERGIFPIVGCCSQSGIDTAADSEIKEIYQDIMERRRSASGVAS
jgi:proteasome beta subunit